MDPQFFGADDAAGRSPAARSRPWPNGLAWFGSLKVRLTLTALLVLFAGMALTAWKLDRVLARDLLAAAEHRERDEARQTVVGLGHRAIELQRALASVADQLDSRAWADMDALESFMRDRAVLAGLFSNIAVVDAEGRIRLVADAVGTRRPDARVSDREYFRRTMATGDPMIDGPVPGRVSGEPVLMFTHPLEVGGERVGLLGGAVRLASRDLLVAFGEERTNDGVVVVVTDGAGRVMAHPQHDRIGTSIDDIPGFESAARAWAAAGRLPIIDPRSWASTATVVGVAADLRTGWHVWRSVPTGNLLAPIREARNKALTQAAVLAGALALALVIWLGRLLRPLALLERRAHALLAGDADTTWPQATGEIGQLARTLQHVSTERRQVEQFNQRVLDQLDSVMAAAPVGLAFTRDRRFEMASVEFCRLLGASAAQLHGSLAREIFASNEDYDALGRRVAEAFGSARPYDGEHQMLRRDGTVFWGHLRAQPVVAGAPAAGTIWSLADITAQVVARRDLEHAALHDPLTGLANRKAFDQAVAAAVVHAAPERPMSLLMIDLDRFKPINDSAGHAAGDAMLQAVAGALVRHVRDRDIVARLGGDEFGVLLDGCDHERARAVAEKIRAAVAAIALPWAGRNLTVGASLGVAPWPAGAGLDAAGWIAAADAACYDAKHAGRDAVRSAAPVVPLRRVGAAQGG